MKNSAYWVNRVANETWNKYNSYEEQNKNLLEFYKEGVLDIEEELYRLMVKMGEHPMLTDMHDNNRLNKLKEKMENIVKELTEKTINHCEGQLSNAIKEQYKDVSVAVGREDFSLPKKKEMEMMLNNPWSGMNYSERVWENNRVLAYNLNEILTRGLIQGKSVMDMTKELNDRMMKGFNRAHVLIRTEVMHYMNESSKKAYKDANVKEVEIYAAEDERTCEHCGNEHNKVYKIDKAPILPFHPRCRCTYLPVVKFEKKKKEDVKVKTWKDFSYEGKEFKNKKEISNHLSKEYNIKFGDSRKYPIDKDILQGAVNWMDKFNSYFKDFHKISPVSIPEFKVKAGVSAVGYYSYYTSKPKAVELVLNGQYFTDKKYNDNYFKRAVESKWTVPGAKSYKTFIHEYGHHVANSLYWLDKQNKSYSGNWCSDFMNDVIMEYNGKYNESISFKDIANLVSRYGGTKPVEAFAETFAEYFGSDEPREFARVFGEKLGDRLNEYIKE